MDVAYAIELERQNETIYTWTGDDAVELTTGATRLAPTGGEFQTVGPSVGISRAMEFTPDGTLLTGGNRFVAAAGGNRGVVSILDKNTAVAQIIATTGTLFGRTIFNIGSETYIIQGVGSLYRYRPGNPVPLLQLGFMHFDNPVVRPAGASTVGSNVYVWNGSFATGWWRRIPTSFFTALDGSAPNATLTLPAPIQATTNTRHEGATTIRGALHTVGYDTAAGARIRISRVAFSPSYSETDVYLIDFSGDGTNARYRSLAFDTTTGYAYITGQGSLHRIAAPGWPLTTRVFEAGQGLLDVQPQGAGLNAGTAAFSLSIVSDDDKWRDTQGPISITLRQVTRAPGGEWEVHPLQWRGVLGASTWIDGVWRGTFTPISQSVRFQARPVTWSNQAQLRRTGGADSGLARMVGGAPPLVFPSEV